VFYVLNGRKLKRYLLAIAGLLLVAGVIYNEKDHITVFAPQMPAAVYSVPTDEKIVALTFDISWGDKRAEPIIEVLKEKRRQGSDLLPLLALGAIPSRDREEDHGRRLRDRQQRT